MSDAQNPTDASRPNRSRPLDEATLRYLDGVAGEAEIEDLFARLKSSEKDRRRFVGVCRHAAMVREAACLRVGSLSPSNPRAVTTRDGLGHFDSRRKPRAGIPRLPLKPGRWGRVGMMAAAAAIVLATAVVAVILSGSGGPSAWPPEQLARVVERAGADRSAAASGAEAAFVAGERLSTGEDEFLRVRTRRGVELLVEGETQLGFESADRVSLQRGGLTALVPARAVGFTVGTPGGDVVDLGTRFAVSVDEAGHAAVRVVDGRVRLDAIAAQDGESAELTAGEGGRITAEGRAARGENDHRTPMVMRRLPASPSAARVLAMRPVGFFPFDRDTQPLVLKSQGETAPLAADGLNRAEGGPLASGGGIALLSQGDAPTILPGVLDPLTRGGAYTFTLWIRPATLASQNVFTATDSTGPDHRIGPQLRLRPNGVVEHVGPDGKTVQPSRRALLVDQWSFVAITMGRYRRMNLYLNGEPVGRPTTSGVNMDASSGDLAIGGPAGRRRGVEDHLAAFAGGLDELAWFDRELTPVEIASLYRRVSAR